MTLSNNGNQYFEQLNRLPGEYTEEILLQRMAECNAILGDMTKGIAWVTLLKDVRRLIKDLDDNWQHIPPTDPKFESARVMKMGCSIISDFPNKYSQELKRIEEELQKMRDPNNITKDSDNE